jgi:chemotaxis protein histidine kinase CheA
MSEESQRLLFQPFFRAPEARALPGHGLGLATTKRLVEAHGGVLIVKSSLGAGTQVTVRFPLAAASPEAVAVVRTLSSPEVPATSADSSGERRESGSDVPARTAVPRAESA